MENKDYPSLYQAADSATIDSQKKYIWLMGFDLLSMVISSLLALYNIENESFKIGIYIITGLLLLISLILTIILKTYKYEDVWYQGRAVAESVKTLTWRYITNSANFEINLKSNEADDAFINSIEQIQNEIQGIREHLDSNILNLPVITDKMKAERVRPLNERMSFYIKYRIQQQKEWYASKAEYNSRKRHIWFLVILVSQALSIISVVYLIMFPLSKWNLVGLFTTISSAIIAWLQLKQHQELKQAYTTATMELNIIESKVYNIHNDEDFSKFVLDSENAISREHTLWLAQQRKY